MAISFADNTAWPSWPPAWPSALPPAWPWTWPSAWPSWPPAWPSALPPAWPWTWPSAWPACPPAWPPGLDGHSESHRSSTNCRRRRLQRLRGYSSRNDCPTNRGHEAIGDGELGFGQAGLGAASNHVQGYRSHALDVRGLVQRSRQQGIAGHGVVRFTQHLQREWRRKTTGIPNLQPVREEHDLHAAIARVVAMRHGVDDGFGHDLSRNLVRSGGTGAFRTRADGSGIRPTPRRARESVPPSCLKRFRIRPV